jgi:hypothetical protein
MKNEIISPVFGNGNKDYSNGGCLINIHRGVLLDEKRINHTGEKRIFNPVDSTGSLEKQKIKQWRKISQKYQ